LSCVSVAGGTDGPDGGADPAGALLWYREAVACRCLPLAVCTA
jgi:hypothetical protein